MTTKKEVLDEIQKLVKNFQWDSAEDEKESMEISEKILKQTALAIFKELIREGHDGNFCEVDGMHIHMEEWQRIKEKWTR